MPTSLLRRVINLQVVVDIDCCSNPRHGLRPLVEYLSARGYIIVRCGRFCEAARELNIISGRSQNEQGVGRSGE